MVGTHVCLHMGCHHRVLRVSGLPFPLSWAMRADRVLPQWIHTLHDRVVLIRMPGTLTHRTLHCLACPHTVIICHHKCRWQRGQHRATGESVKGIVVSIQSFCKCLRMSQKPSDCPAGLEICISKVFSPRCDRPRIPCRKLRDYASLTSFCF